MRSVIVTAAAAAALLAFVVAPATATAMKTAMVSSSDELQTAATARTDRTVVARQKGGATKRGFCPPGQKKKPGKGSAFNC
jgi:hypothetical protein